MYRCVPVLYRLLFGGLGAYRRAVFDDLFAGMSACGGVSRFINVWAVFAGESADRRLTLAYGFIALAAFDIWSVK